jgi:hypothetical protein
MNSWQITMNARQISKRPAVLSPTFIIALSIDRHAVEIRTENTDHDASVLPQRIVQPDTTRAGGPLLPGNRTICYLQKIMRVPHPSTSLRTGFLAYFARSGAFHVHPSQTSQRSRRTIPECSFRAYVFGETGPVVVNDWSVLKMKVRRRG